MCDTVCIFGSESTLFAKNSDRPYDEAQTVSWHPDRQVSQSGELNTQYLTIPDADTHGVLLSRPTWLWGAEHGVNELGVVIGNELLHTNREFNSQPDALLGMDLVRLGLERSGSAAEALEVMTELIERYGQGGSGKANTNSPYDSSFLICDPGSGWILETCGNEWVAQKITRRAAISNAISIGPNWSKSSSRLEVGFDTATWIDQSVDPTTASQRLDATTACVIDGSANTPNELVAAMRHHGRRPWGAPGTQDTADLVPPDHSVTSVCMHRRDLAATTSSMICEMPSAQGREPRAWICIGSPCVGVYIPVFLPSLPTGLASKELWHRSAQLRDQVEDERTRIHEVRAILDLLETQLWADADELIDAPREQQLSFSEQALHCVSDGLDILGV